ncbi:MAG TPA: uroporphyrinogen-III C-methyltransferase [Burkholderiaceae bacterium]|jgi:uroporphyrin-III C-methyltransferase|nr:uroporphyrinogen-III C-methyltransferase [Burkholderiaceae bacterium]
MAERAPRVWLVGAGPGNPDLLTVQALKLLARARVVIHDALVSDDILALAPQALRVPVGKRAGRVSTRQARINELLVVHALALDPESDDLVVRLKGGDPLIFARAQEEIDALRAAGIAFGVAPGITAAQAGHAAIGAPMTRRGQRRALVLSTPQVEAGGGGDLSWARPLLASGGGALYMAATAAARVQATLLVMGMPADLPVTWVIDASLPTQRLVSSTLGRLARDAPVAGPPALLLIGCAPPELTAARNEPLETEATAAARPR